MSDTETVVVGVDFSSCSENALNWAIEEARRTGRQLLLVHVWHWSSAAIPAAATGFGVADPVESGRRLLLRSAALARGRGVEVSTRLMDGSAPAALAEASDSAAMLVVGSHGRGRFATAVMGSVSAACTHRASCPVVIVTGPLHEVVPEYVPSGERHDPLDDGTAIASARREGEVAT